jgi:hypothetical protein
MTIIIRNNNNNNNSNTHASSQAITPLIQCLENQPTCWEKDLNVPSSQTVRSKRSKVSPGRK